ncbi:MAG: hypothetical protein RSE06_14275, partial [Comamonas sp.]
MRHVQGRSQGYGVEKVRIPSLCLQRLHGVYVSLYRRRTQALRAQSFKTQAADSGCSTGLAVAVHQKI